MPHRFRRFDHDDEEQPYVDDRWAVDDAFDVEDLGLPPRDEVLASLPPGFEHYRFRVRPEVAEALKEMQALRDDEDGDAEL